MKDKAQEDRKDLDKEALLKKKKEENPDELEDSTLENLSGGEGMNMGDIIGS